MIQVSFEEVTMFAARRETFTFVFLGLFALQACTANRGLKISEVGVGVLELYLDEPAGNRLGLDDHFVEIKTIITDPMDPMRTIPWERTFELSGSLDGGEYLVLWEQPGRVGFPGYEFYDNFDSESVPGIAFEPGTLAPTGAVDNTKPFSYRIHARRYRYVFPFFYAQDVTDDVVTFGPRPRPAIGGAFTETGALDGVMRSTAVTFARGQTVWRKTDNSTGVEIPQDFDTEDDWRQDDESFGKAK